MVFEVSAAAYIAEVPSYIPVVNHTFVRMVLQVERKRLRLMETCTHLHVHTQKDKIGSILKRSYQEEVAFQEFYLHLANHNLN